MGCQLCSGAQTPSSHPRCGAPSPGQVTSTGHPRGGQLRGALVHQRPPKCPPESFLKLHVTNPESAVKDNGKPNPSQGISCLA